MKKYLEFINENMSQSDALSLFLPLIKEDGEDYQKVGKVEARKAEKGEKVETNTSDGKETQNTAKENEWVIKNIDGSNEEYIISDEKFKNRYKHLKNNIYLPIGECKALKLTKDVLKKLDLPNNFKFKASWGEDMVIKEGDYIATTDNKEVYRIAEKEFLKTYKKK